MSPAFLFYLSLFGLALAWIAGSFSARKFDLISAAFVLAAYSFISLLLQMRWNDIGNAFGNIFRSGAR